MAGAQVLIYGANGYTGELCAERAVAVGHRPILAGRDAGRVQAVARRLRLTSRVFDLEDPLLLTGALADVSTVLLCAGPFSATSAPMVSACLQTRTHYLDITGEIEVFEAVYARHDEAVARGVVLLPGVGFDVVPTDCMAARLAGALPGAVALELAFAGGAGVSPGTAKTVAEGLSKGLRVRRSGEIVALPLGALERLVAFADHARTVKAISWGDVAAAFRSTGIPDITCYARLPRHVGKLVGVAGAVGRALQGPALGLARHGIERAVRGPDPDARAGARSQIWGRAVDRAGAEVVGTVEVPEGYTLSAIAAVDAAFRVAGGEVEPGATTPSRAFGAGYLESLLGVQITLTRT